MLRTDIIKLKTIIREEDMEPILVQRRDYVSLSFTELEQHLKAVEMYTNALMDFIIECQLSQAQKQRLYIENTIMIRYQAKLRKRLQNFTVGEGKP